LIVDPVQFGVFVVCALTVGFITPPVGINLFAASAVGGVPYLSIAWRTRPLFLAQVCAVMIVGFVPWPFPLVPVNMGASRRLRPGPPPRFCQRQRNLLQTSEPPASEPHALAAPDFLTTQ
jgi:di/tricarboxylate transporter